MAIVRPTTVLAVTIAVATTAAAADTPWVPIPLRTTAQRAAGIAPGGEGGQWPRGPVATAASDPNLLLLPIDVGGLFRSTDGGRTWAVAMDGWDARGANGFAIDPADADRVLGVAGNSMAWDGRWGRSPHGVYRSTDRAKTWRQVLPRLEGVGGAVAWDPSHHGLDARAYYLSNGGDLYRSDDAGATWRAVATAVAMPPAADWTAGGTTPTMLAVDGAGAVWAAGTGGVVRSGDGGVTFAPLRTAATFGLSILRDGTAYASGTDGVAVCRDGRTFVKAAGRGLPAGVARGVVASPVDSKRLLCWVARPDWDWPRFVSHDGGDSWRAVDLDWSTATFPCNARQGYAAWNTADPAVAWGLGGDWVTRSTDGGRSFHWSNNGNAGAMVGGLFNFSPAHPRVVLVGLQDYNAASTTDGGQTWVYHDASGKGWGRARVRGVRPVGGR